MDASKRTIEHFVTEKVSAARAGNARAAAVTAALIHCYPELSKGLGISSQYDDLLWQVFFSQDAELIVCVAEELFKGKILASNANLSQRFFDRVEQLSPFMGAYVLARLLAQADKSRAIELFARAEKAGHIPSTIYKHRILAKSLPAFGFVLGIFFGFCDFVLTWRVVRQGHRISERFWRYRDVFPEPLEPVAEVIGADRANIFGELSSDLSGCTNQQGIDRKSVTLSQAS